MGMRQWGHAGPAGKEVENNLQKASAVFSPPCASCYSSDSTSQHAWPSCQWSGHRSVTQLPGTAGPLRRGPQGCSYVLGPKGRAAAVPCPVSTRGSGDNAAEWWEPHCWHTFPTAHPTAMRLAGGDSGQDHPMCWGLAAPSSATAGCFPVGPPVLLCPASLPISHCPSILPSMPPVPLPMYPPLYPSFHPSLPSSIPPFIHPSLQPSVCPSLHHSLHSSHPP